MQKNWLIVNLNKKYFLKVGKKVFRCQIGAEGLKKATKKVEGDKTTPIGKWNLVSLYYRADKVLRPKFKKKNALKINRITKHCGWWTGYKVGGVIALFTAEYFEKIGITNYWQATFLILGALVILMNIGLMFIHEPIATDRQAIQKETDKIISGNLIQTNP